MAILTNPKHELFAQEVAKGATLERAYEKAGYQPSRKNAQRLRTNEGVSSRIEELLSQAAERAGVTIEAVVTELAKIGFSDIRRAVKWGAGISVPDGDGEARISNGVSMKSSEEIDDDTASAISEVTQTKEGIRIKLHDKRAALVDLGRHLGMFKDRVEHSGPDGGPIQVEDTDSIRQRMAAKLSRIAANVAHGETT